MFQIAEKYTRSYLLTYLVVSLLLSLIITVRSIFALNMIFLNIILYDIYYYAMPSIAIFNIFMLLIKPNSEKQSKQEELILTVIYLLIIAMVFYALFSIDFCFNTPLSYVIFPVTPALMTYLHFKRSTGKLLSRKKAALILAIVISAPYVVAFLGFNSTLYVARAKQDNADRIEFISDYVRNTTASFWGLEGVERKYVSLHRANTDFLKFLLVSVGSCGEIAHATKVFFDNLGIESRIVSFPGEDHMFVEAKLNDTWLVVDPGYQLNLVTREERGSTRLEKLGGLSYVVTYTDRGLIELTRYYVTADKVVIRVTDNGEPIANARIALRHTFMGDEMSLPEFYSNVNGTIELNLGPLAYNSSEIEPAEPYFWIYVNSVNTESKVSSTGIGEYHYIEIDLADIDG